MFDILNVKAISRITFFQHQQNYLQPAVHLVWTKQQKSLLQQQGVTIAVAGDGRADSPGHSTKYGTYSLLKLVEEDHCCSISGRKLHTNNVLMTWVHDNNYCLIYPHSSEMKSSYSTIIMEKQGLERALKFLKEGGIKLEVLVTDRHKIINKWLRESHSAIKHYFDVWHIAKGK